MSAVFDSYEEFERITDETKCALNKVSSRQRHDFMNMLQIITGYLQIDEHDRALNIALEYGQRTESIGRLQKHGLLMGSYIIEYYINVFSNNERKIEIINSLPPTEPTIRKEKRAALELMEGLLEWYSKEPIEKMTLHFELVEKNIQFRMLVPEHDRIEFMDLILIYKNQMPNVRFGTLKMDAVWDYIEFPLLEHPITEEKNVCR